MLRQLVRPIAIGCVAFAFAPLPATMQTYPVRPGHAAKTDLKMLFEAAFDSCTEKDGWLKDTRGTAAIVYLKTRAEIVVVLTYRPGITLTESRTLGAAVSKLAFGE